VSKKYGKVAELTESNIKKKFSFFPPKICYIFNKIKKFTNNHIAKKPKNFSILFGHPIYKKLNILNITEKILLILLKVTKF